MAMVMLGLPATIRLLPSTASRLQRSAAALEGQDSRDRQTAAMVLLNLQTAAAAALLSILLAVLELSLLAAVVVAVKTAILGLLADPDMRAEAEPVLVEAMMQLSPISVAVPVAQPSF